MALKITIGLDKYSGPACGFNFEDSVCMVEVEGDIPMVTQRNLNRLKMLYRGTTIEEIDGEKPKKEKPKKEKVAPSSTPALEESKPELEPEAEVVDVADEEVESEDKVEAVEAGEETEVMSAADEPTELDKAVAKKQDKKGKKGKKGK